MRQMSMDGVPMEQMPTSLLQAVVRDEWIVCTNTTGLDEAYAKGVCRDIAARLLRERGL
jgi:hypothetical protein